MRVVAALTFCFFYCFFVLSACDQPQPAAQAVETVKLAYTNQPQSALIQIALDQGFFQKEGLRIDATPYDLGKLAMESMLKGNNDIATVAETPIMYHVMNGGDISIFANVVTANTNNGVVARRDAGIDRPEDLKGKRIGYPKGTSAEFFLSTILTAHGLQMRDIEAVNLQPNEMQQAIVEARVDALSIWNYRLSLIADTLGYNGVVFSDKELYTESYNLVSQPDYVKAHPLVIKSLLRALLRAEEFNLNHPGEAQEIMSRRTGVPLALVKKIWPEFKFKLSLAPSLLITLDDEARWAEQNQLVKPNKEPDFLAHIYFDALKEVKPDAVKIRS